MFLAYERLANGFLLGVHIHAVVICVYVKIRCDSVNQRWLRYLESLIIKLGDFSAQEFIYISLVGQYKVFVSALH